ncbi:MAG: hypothetical protein PWP46_2187 [Fusobacteriaceae bacterium]|jgi:hypothetical protein|nr:hypothetical protein [Caldanaerobacter sp.]MDN5305300.1 hypothetical protein [Fusobacteriaceae bacterium]TCW31590.1 hypothetical protein EDC21_1372 [Thermohydrogenium kirishiense]
MRKDDIVAAYVHNSISERKKGVHQQILAKKEDRPYRNMQ